MKKTIPFLFLVLALLSCNLPALPFFGSAKPTPAGSIHPKFVNHSQFILPMNLKPFQDAGCKADPQGLLRCPPNVAPFNRLGCYDISQASPLLGGLKTGIAVMLCTLEPQPGTQVPQDSYLYAQGCLAPTFIRLAVGQNGQFQVIKNQSELKKTFAPIDTPEKALSYALAATGFQALYGLKDENLRYLAPQIEDTFVKQTAEGYDLQLFSFGTCGCGPHAMSIRPVHVSKAGDVVSDDARPVWEDPAQDGLCVD
jgi:hypothetical protein